MPSEVSFNVQRTTPEFQQEREEVNTQEGILSSLSFEDHFEGQLVF
jgi:hypothetical protein